MADAMIPTDLSENSMEQQGRRSPTMGWKPVEFRPIDGPPIEAKRIFALTIADVPGSRMFVVQTRDFATWEAFRPGRLGGFSASEWDARDKGTITATHESARVVVASRTRHGEAMQFVEGTIVLVEC